MSSPNPPPNPLPVSAADPPNRRWTLLPRPQLKTGRTFGQPQLKRLLKRVRQAKRRLKWRERQHRLSQEGPLLPSEAFRDMLQGRAPPKQTIPQLSSSLSWADSLLSERSISREMRTAKRLTRHKAR